MSKPPAMIAQLEEIITKNTVKYFLDRPVREKTVENVESIAQKQLDYFIEGMIRQSEELWKMWKGGHPFLAKAAIDKRTMDFKIQIIEREEKTQKW